MKYTIELRYIENNKNIDLFEDVKFYEPLQFENFKRKFFDRYKFYEIGFETIERFKHFLKTTLNENYDYYIELYNTIVESKKCNFLLNKDLKESITREIENSSIGENENSNNTTQTFLDTPSSKMSIEENLEKFISSGGINKDRSNSKTSNTSNGKETTTLISQGNIGVTSSAQLLKEWRESIINLDSIILDDLRDLFMMVY